MKTKANNKTLIGLGLAGLAVGLFLVNRKASAGLALAGQAPVPAAGTSFTGIQRDPLQEALSRDYPSAFGGSSSEPLTITITQDCKAVGAC